MDDLIGRLVANTGVDRTAAERAVGIVPQFLSKEGPTEQVQALMQHVLGADTAILPSSPSSRSPGMFAAIGGAMGFGSQMMTAGPSADEIQVVIREATRFAHETAGETQSARSSARSPVSASSSDA
jgi:hypothetical protein